MIQSARLQLVPATSRALQAAIDGPSALAHHLNARVPPTWPPEFLDEPALLWVKARLEAAPDEAAWWMYFVILPDPRDMPTLIGTGGFKGPPADGTVEIGYGIVSDQRRRGYASEAANALVAHAFADERVRRVIAETLPELVGSQGVLRVCGFSAAGPGSEPGVLRYERCRAPQA